MSRIMDVRNYGDNCTLVLKASRLEADKAEAFKAELAAAWHSDIRTITMDLHAVEAIDRAAVSAILSFYRRLPHPAGTLRLRHVHPSLRAQFELMKLVPHVFISDDGLPAAPAPAALPLASHTVIHRDPACYCAWPALVRAANGDLLLAFVSTDHHLGPNGRVVTMRSSDHGVTWSEPVVAYDTPIDDRECGLTLLPDGRIAMHVWSTFWKEGNYTCLPIEAYPPDVIAGWVRHVNTPAYRAAEKWHGGWVIVSSDHGRTWSAPVRGPDTVHGGIALQDGSLLTAGYRTDAGHIGLYAAGQPEGPWRKVAVVQCPTPQTHHFGEPHLLQLPTGRILLMIRFTAHAYDDKRDDLHLWESYSDDNGRTWAPPFRTPLLGFPPHLALLGDGRVLCTYGYRRPPYGERAALSRDGLAWNVQEEIILRDDNANHDLGYPASLEVSPGVILTVYYQKPAFNPADIHAHKACIVATRWRVPTA